MDDAFAYISSHEHKIGMYKLKGKASIIIWLISFNEYILRKNNSEYLLKFY